MDSGTESGNDEEDAHMIEAAMVTDELDRLSRRGFARLAAAVLLTAGAAQWRWRASRRVKQSLGTTTAAVDMVRMIRPVMIMAAAGTGKTILPEMTGVVKAAARTIPLATTVVVGAGAAVDGADNTAWTGIR
jgi:hypothetical protein